MARLADLLEDYRNLVGRANWSIGRDIDVMSGYDPDLAEFVERSSLGTGSHGLGAGGLAGMIKASHGSPHAFTKFDFSKIGTGEGAQAYGHGGYFAQGFDSPVAQEYRDVLSESTLMHNGNPVNAMDDSPKANALKAIAAQGYEPSLKRANEMLEEGADPAWMKKYIQELDALKNDDVGWKTGGHLYNVELRWPDAAREAADPLGEHHLLDWDAPISQQSNQVREVIQSNPVVQKRAEQMFSDMGKGLSPLGAERMQAATGGVSGILGKTSGSEAYQAIMNELEGNPELASKYLRDLGIPGIRYLDQGSRVTSGGNLVDVFKGPQGWHSKIKVTNRSGAGFSEPTDSFTTSMPFKTEKEARDWAESKIGAGTRNYVMFDDALANIVSRNGVSLSDLLRR